MGGAGLCLFKHVIRRQTQHIFSSLRIFRIAGGEVFVAHALMQSRSAINPRRSHVRMVFKGTSNLAARSA